VDVSPEEAQHLLRNLFREIFCYYVTPHVNHSQPKCNISQSHPFRTKPLKYTIHNLTQAPSLSRLFLENLLFASTIKLFHITITIILSLFKTVR